MFSSELLHHATLLAYFILHITLFLEYRNWRYNFEEQGVWCYQNIRAEFENTFHFINPRLLEKLMTTILDKILFVQPIFYFILTLSVFFSIYFSNLSSLFYFIQLACLINLLIMHLLLCLRFRGLYNGGSDMMMMVVAIGLIVNTICLLAKSHLQFGLIYIAIHVTVSYLKAGYVKIQNPDWLDGSALKHFISTTDYKIIRLFSKALSSHFFFKKIISFAVYATLFFELTFPLLYLNTITLCFYLSVVFLFHLTVFFIFCLNRFFWAWIATWPGLIYLFKLIHQL